MCPGRTFSAIFFWKNSLLFSFPDFEQNFCENFSEILSANFFTWTEFYVYRRTNWEKTSYGGLRYHSFFPDFERWVNVTSGKKGFRGACQKCLLRFQRNFLEKTTLWELSYRWLLLEFERKPCGTILKLLLRVQWNSVRKLYFLRRIKVFCRFHTICETLSQFQTILAGLSSQHSPSPVEHFEDILVWMKKFSGFH